MKKVLFSTIMMLMYTFTFSQLSLIETHQNPSCFGGCNGVIYATPNNVVGTVTYTWLPIGTNSNSLCAGQYTVLAEDSGANTASLSITISQPNQIIASAVAQNSAACWCNGSASVTVTGGNPPYNYVWNNPWSTITPQVTNLCPGITQVSVTDINGCVATTTVAISAPQFPSFTSTTTNSSCQSTCNGSATVIANSGTPPYTYNWQFNGGQSFQTYTTSTVQNLCVSFATLTVTDANGCATTSMVTVGASTVNNIPNTSITTLSYNETCFQSNDGSIDLNVSGSNNGPFTYLWNNGATTQDIYNLQTNIYSVTITDANSNCYTLFDTINSIGINCGSISGNIYIDNNSDCIKNSGDNNYQNASIVVNPGNRLGYANTNGDYFINNLPYDTYSLSIGNMYNGLIPSCTTTINATINSGQPNSYNNNLSAGFNSTTQPDIKVTSWSGGIVPGFSNYMTYTLNNQNNVNGSGIFKAVLPSAFIPNITLVTPSTYTLSGDTVMWMFTNLNYPNNYSTSFVIQFTTPISTPLGSVFTSCAYAQTSIPDFNPANNTYCYQRTVTGSYDPNDKTVSPIGVGTTGDIAASVTDLTYLIRFQNTGNGPAVNIVVKDTLSPNVDVNTFEMLSSSHNYNIEILPGNILKWKFNNIMLPDSNSNEPGSHGYIQYRIKRTNNNTPGTQIKNTAYIYFDFNEPVITNTAINTIETITGITSPLSNNDGWNVYPNPSTGALYIVNSSVLKESSQVLVLNAIGQTVLEENITSNYKNIDLSKLNNGVYFVKITSDKQSVIKKVVLSK